MAVQDLALVSESTVSVKKYITASYMPGKTEGFSLEGVEELWWVLKMERLQLPLNALGIVGVLRFALVADGFWLQVEALEIASEVLRAEVDGLWLLVMVEELRCALKVVGFWISLEIVVVEREKSGECNNEDSAGGP
jgi:hypothetical protein